MRAHPNELFLERLTGEQLASLWNEASHLGKKHTEAFREQLTRLVLRSRMPEGIL